MGFVPPAGGAAAKARRSGGVGLLRCLLLLGLAGTILTSAALIVCHEHRMAEARGADGGRPFFVRAAGGRGEDGAGGADASDPPGDWPPVLSAYVEDPSSTDVWYVDPKSAKPRPKVPLPPRTPGRLTRVDFPSLVHSPGYLSDVCPRVPSLLPVDRFGSPGLRDAYLPWVHDLFVASGGAAVSVVAQNRRRCHKGRKFGDEMRFWEGQVALFQPVSVRRARGNSTADDGASVYRLTDHGGADPDGSETRFVCRFKTADHARRRLVPRGETLSTYPFNYEFVNWRKGKDTMVQDDKDQAFFWLSPLMFDCPIPAGLRGSIGDGAEQVLLDIIPIRTPARRNDRDGYFFHDGHGGPTTFDAVKAFGTDHPVPDLDRSGRWENLPVCRLPRPAGASSGSSSTGEVATKKAASGRRAKGAKSVANPETDKPHRLVACTWTSALHQRRGNERRISDGTSRLREWIAYNLLVGFDHVYVYDNTGANSTMFRLRNEADPDLGANGTAPVYGVDYRDLSSVTDLFPPDKVTRVDWPATICNNNRPNHPDPGERSSQYAAEASCRTRYGPHADWMASMDPDEYFVPMGGFGSWKEVLDGVDGEGRSVLKFRSTRARPLMDTLVPIVDESIEECTQEMANKYNPCLAKDDARTYLETYNCEYIKSPKPTRFERAMKQFYRPDFVLSHFVHYSTVTTTLATERNRTVGRFVQLATNDARRERFVDELKEGVLVHAKTTVPAETSSRYKMCRPNAPEHCLVGIPCPDDLPFDDKRHKDNIFHDGEGNFCNCWVNRRVEGHWLPRLRDALGSIG